MGISRRFLIVELIFVGALIIFAILNWRSAINFAEVVAGAKLWWLILAVLIQLGTYAAAATIWNIVIRNEGEKIGVGALARFSVEKLSVNQLIPAAGIAGNVVVVRMMKNCGISTTLAMEALLIDIFSNYVAYTLGAVLAIFVLWYHHHLTGLILYLMAAFAIVLVMVLTIIWRLLNNQKLPLPKWVLRMKALKELSSAAKQVDPAKVRSPRLIVSASLLNFSIFILDAATLWVLIEALGSHLTITTCFAAFIIASIAGTVSFLPGGVGGFEAGGVAILTVLGAPIAVAITSILLFRGFTLWIPLIPGLIFARRDARG